MALLQNPHENEIRTCRRPNAINLGGTGAEPLSAPPPAKLSSPLCGPEAAAGGRRRCLALFCRAADCLILPGIGGCPCLFSQDKVDVTFSSSGRQSTASRSSPAPRNQGPAGYLPQNVPTAQRVAKRAENTGESGLGQWHSWMSPFLRLHLFFVDLSNALIKDHARLQMERRQIDLALVQAVLNKPDAILPVRTGRVVAQSVVDSFLIRVFVDVDRQPPEVVTAYRTSKISKYRS
jgi:hypothetical protein